MPVSGLAREWIEGFPITLSEFDFYVDNSSLPEKIAQDCSFGLRHIWMACYYFEQAILSGEASITRSSDSVVGATRADGKYISMVPVEMYGGLVNRIKIMSGIDMATKDRDQVGQMRAGKYFLEVRTGPNLYGFEDVNIKLK